MNEIDKLIDDFARQTEVVSSTSMMLEVPTAAKLIEIGNDVVPALLRFLKREPSVGIMVLLERITGENPVPANQRGDLDKMAKAWLRWARQPRSAVFVSTSGKSKAEIVRDVALQLRRAGMLKEK